MRYFVIAPDGSKFGPADQMTLRAWIGEGRIVPDTMLEEEGTGKRVQARTVLPFTEVPQFSPPQSYGGARPEVGRRGDDGNSDVIISYICSAMTILCCCFFNIGGFVYANRAISKGNKRGHTARVVAIVFLILWIVTTLLTIPFLGQLKDIVMKMIDQQQQQGGMF